MKKKRRIFLCCLMSLLMVFVMAVPMSASAAVSETNVVKIGDVGYDTLGDAVAAVEADKTETTITFLKDCSGGGVVVKANQNIVFDLAGHTYEVGKPTVGSSGTETNGFQFLKDAKVTIKNGIIEANAYEDLKILIQNYSNLTLEDVALDTVGAAPCQYAVSNNFGNVNIKGDSSIYTGDGQTALDVYYWPNVVYSEGVSVTVDTTGIISGKITYGCENSEPGKNNVAEKAKLEIKQGYFDGTFETYGLKEDGKTGIQISGGVFENPVSKEYMSEAVTTEATLNSTLDDGTEVTLYIIGTKDYVSDILVGISEEGDIIKVEKGEVDFNGTIITPNDGDVAVHVHETEHVAAKAPTCTEKGNIEYWYCKACGAYFSDEECKNEIKAEATVLAAKGHAYKDGKCTVCGAAEAAGGTQQNTEAETLDPSAETGDDSNMVLPFVLMALAGMTAVGTVVFRRRNHQ